MSTLSTPGVGLEVEELQLEKAPALFPSLERLAWERDREAMREGRRVELEVGDEETPGSRGW